MTLDILPSVDKPPRLNGWLVAAIVMATATLLMSLWPAPLWCVALGVFAFGFCAGRADSERTMNAQYLQTVEAVAKAEHAQAAAVTKRLLHNRNQHREVKTEEE